MLKELFEAHFYGTFSETHDSLLMLDERIECGDFALLDPKACIGCKFVCNTKPGEREQLKIHSAQSVSILSLDQVFSYVSEKVGETCDYLLEGSSTTAVVEMTCSTADYVVDKRQKARRQLYNTLLLLNTNPVVRKHLEKKQVRYAIFSWRETYMNGKDSVESSMEGMTLMVDEVYSPYNESKFDFGYKLREIRYPDIFICN